MNLNERNTLKDSGKLVILTSRILWLCQGSSSRQMLFWEWSWVSTCYLESLSCQKWKGVSMCV